MPQLGREPVDGLPVGRDSGPEGRQVGGTRQKPGRIASAARSSRSCGRGRSSAPLVYADRRQRRQEQERHRHGADRQFRQNHVGRLEGEEQQREHKAVVASAKTWRRGSRLSTTPRPDAAAMISRAARKAGIMQGTSCLKPVTQQQGPPGRVADRGAGDEHEDCEGNKLHRAGRDAIGQHPGGGQEAPARDVDEGDGVEPVERRAHADHAETAQPGRQHGSEEAKISQAGLTASATSTRA